MWQLLYLIFLYITLIFAAIYWSKQFKHYKINHPGSIVADKIDSPPSNKPPAYVGILLNQDHYFFYSQKVFMYPHVAFLSTIIDLARRGVLSIQATKQKAGHLQTGIMYEYNLYLKDSSYRNNLNILPFEKSVIEFIYKDQPENMPRSLNGLVDYCIKSGENWGFFMTWPKQIAAAADIKRIVEPDSRNLQIKFIIVNSILFTVLTVLNLFIFPAETEASTFVYFIVGIIVVTIIILFAKSLLRWNDNMELELKQWNAYYNYLCRLADAKTDKEKISLHWEDHLVYGTMLGIAPTIADSLQSLILHSGKFPAWYSLDKDHFQNDYNIRLAESLSHMIPVFQKKFYQAFYIVYTNPTLNKEFDEQNLSRSAQIGLGATVTEN